MMASALDAQRQRVRKKRILMIINLFYTIRLSLKIARRDYTVPPGENDLYGLNKNLIAEAGHNRQCLQNSIWLAMLPGYSFYQLH
jgi:hypothetical protein